VSTIASPIAQVNAAPAIKPAPAKVSVGKAPPAQAEAPVQKADPIQQIQADKEVRVQRLNQALDKSQLNYSFDKTSNKLSVKVVNKQSGEFIRQIDFQGFNAMAFLSHGYKGRYVDNAA
jgi:FlaG protein